VKGIDKWVPRERRVSDSSGTTSIPSIQTDKKKEKGSPTILTNSLPNLNKNGSNVLLGLDFNSRNTWPVTLKMNRKERKTKVAGKIFISDYNVSSW